MNAQHTLVWIKQAGGLCSLNSAFWCGCMVYVNGFVKTLWRHLRVQFAIHIKTVWKELLCSSRFLGELLVKLLKCSWRSMFSIVDNGYHKCSLESQDYKKDIFQNLVSMNFICSSISLCCILEPSSVHHITRLILFDEHLVWKCVLITPGCGYQFKLVYWEHYVFHRGPERMGSFYFRNWNHHLKLYFELPLVLLLHDITLLKITISLITWNNAHKIEE